MTTINICGKPFTVSLCDGSGGHFDTLSRTIQIGRELDARNRFDTFVHEIIETVLQLRDFRYGIYSNTNEKLKFVMDHAEFTIVCDDIASALVSAIGLPDVGLDGGEDVKASSEATKTTT
jgi:hypothetical protein